MRATVLYGAGDVRVESVPDPRLAQPSDALVRVTQACSCGSDLWPVQRVRDLTGGLGAHSVLECVGHGLAMETALSIARPGGAVGRVGVPQEETIPAAQPSFYNNVTIAGGPAPARAYVEELLPDILEGRIEPGRVFDRVTGLDGVPDGYRAMNDRQAIKVMIGF